MITFQNLIRHHGDVLAVDSISFTTEAGNVTDFLGPDSASKSTVMRRLIGLAFPIEGKTLINGCRYYSIPNPSARVDALLNTSARYSGRTGRETLRAAAITMGVPRSQMGEVIELAGLTVAEIRRRVGVYSLGMGQYLGVAQVFFDLSRALILDESANGLDPQGIYWMRTTLRRFADAGGTVLLSSHLFHEVQQVADRAVIIGHGRIPAEGGIADLTIDGTDFETTFLSLTTIVARGRIFA